MISLRKILATEFPKISSIKNIGASARAFILCFLFHCKARAHTGQQIEPDENNVHYRLHRLGLRRLLRNPHSLSQNENNIENCDKTNPIARIFFLTSKCFLISTEPKMPISRLFFFLFVVLYFCAARGCELNGI